MVRSMTKRGMPKPFAILLAALMALYFVPLGALPASAATVGGFEIEGNLIDDTDADPPIDWFDLGPGSPGFSTGVDNVDNTGKDTTTFQGSSKEFDTTGNGAWPNWDFGSGNATGKSDFGRWATYDYVDSSDHVWFFLGFDRGSGTGTAKYAFELNQITQSPTTDANPDRSQGDIRLVIYDQGNGLVTLAPDAQNPDVGLYVWKDPDQPAGGVAEDTDKDGSWVKITNAGIFEGASNTGETPVAVPTWWTGGNVSGGTLAKDQFLEFGIDLTSFGAVLSCPSSGFSAVNARSITGTGGPGTLVDYLEAIPVTIPSNCASLFIRKFMGNGTTPLGGATFQITPNPLPTGVPGSDLTSLIIFDDSDGNTTVEPGTNYDDPDADAGEISISAVRPGIEYTVTEVAAPDGWIKDNSSVKVTPVAFGTSQSASNTASFVNHRGSVTFYKDYEGADPQTGASFTLTRDNDDADALYNNGTVQVTDNGANDSAPAIGVITVDPLDAGSWKLIEDVGGAPTGWIRDNTEILFTVPDAQGNRNVTLVNPTLSDPRRTYPLTVRKVAKADNSVRVNGAVFDLYKETNGAAGLQLAGDTKVGTCTTSGNGECSVTGLAWDASYYWYEVSVPAPYNLPSNRVVGPITLNADGSSSPSGTAVFQDPQSAIRTQATNGSLPNATISDTAYVTGVNNSNTGSVTFYIYGPLGNDPVTSTSCGFSVVDGAPNYESGPNYLTKVTDSTGVKNDAGEWVYESGAVAVTGSGNYAWVAVYGGDVNGNRSVAGICGDPNEKSNVPPLTTGITTVAMAPDAQLPATELYDTAKVFPVTGNLDVTGTAADGSDYANIDFYLYGPDDTACTGTPVFTSENRPVQLVADGSSFYATAESLHYTGAGAGKYRWVAHFDGDANNADADSPCNAVNEDSTVKKAEPTVTTEAGPDKTLGQSGVTLEDTATLSGGTSDIKGTITFKLYFFPTNPIGDTQACADGTPIATRDVPVTHGNGDYSSGGVLVQWAGWYTWTAQYSPVVPGDAPDDANNKASAVHGCGLDSETVKVNPIQPTIVTEVPARTVTLGADGSDLTDTATLSGGTITPKITGTITFRLYGPFTAVPGANSCVTPLTGAHNPQTVDVTNGNGSYTTPNAVHVSTVGFYTWVASYNGDANNVAATHACGLASETVQVLPRQPVITTDVPGSNTLTLGANGVTLSDTATLSQATSGAGGAISFQLFGPFPSAPTAESCTEAIEFGEPVGTTSQVSGNGTYTSLEVTVTQAGFYTWVATYDGDANNESATHACGLASETVVVNKAVTDVMTVATASAIIKLGQTITDAASVTGLTDDATGSVTFSLFGPDNATCSGTPIFTSTVPLTVTVSGSGATGSATSAAFTPTAAGTYRWIASYSGDGNNAVSAGECNDPNERSLVRAGDNPGLDKFSDPASGSTVQPGSTINYSVKVFNTGDVAITNADVVDVLPPHVTANPASISDAGVLSADKTTITWKVTLAPADASSTADEKTFTYSATVNQAAPEGAVLVNTARFQGLVDTTTHVVPTGDLTVLKEVSPVAGNGVVVEFGDELTYTLTATASGEQNQTNVIVTDYVPGFDPARAGSGSTTYVLGSATCVGVGTCTVTEPGADGLITWSLGSMAAGTSRQVTFKVTIDEVPGAPGETVAVDILNAGAVQSTETAKTPSNEVVTPVTQVFAVKVGQPPTVQPAVLPRTGSALPPGPLAGVAIGLLGLGLLLLSAGRRPGSHRRS